MMDINQINKQNKALGSIVKFGEEKDHSGEELEDMDEEQIKQIFKEEGLIKLEKSEMKEEKLFENVECAYSFYSFSKQNLFRIWSYKATKHGMWENTVFLLIGLSSFKLVTDSYTNTSSNELVHEIS